MSASFSVTIPDTGAVTVASAIAFPDRDPRGGGSHTGERLDPSRRAPARSLATTGARPGHGPAPRRRSRAIAPVTASSRLCVTRVRGKERFEAIDVGLRRGQFHFDGAHLRVGGRRLRVGLADVFDTSAGDEKSKLRVGLVPLRPGAGERELRVGRVEACHEVAGLDAVALVDAQLDQASADLRGNLDVRGLDLAGHTRAVGHRFCAHAPAVRAIARGQSARQAVGIMVSASSRLAGTPSYAKERDSCRCRTNSSGDSVCRLTTFR